MSNLKTVYVNKYIEGTKTRVVYHFINSERFIYESVLYDEDDECYSIYQPWDYVTPEQFLEYINDPGNETKGTIYSGYESLSEALCNL